MADDRLSNAWTALVILLLVVAGAWLAWAYGSVYEWTITAPDGRVVHGEGEDYDFVPLQPGPHQIELRVRYRHEDPLNPGELYTATAVKVLFVTGEDLRQIFADDFETGTTGGWSVTHGGHHE
jgi:hypothetical protein